MEPYDPIPGRVPRKVAIDRRKKEYASFSIEQLLSEKGNWHHIQVLTLNKRLKKTGCLFTISMTTLSMITPTRAGSTKKLIRMATPEDWQEKDLDWPKTGTSISQSRFWATIQMTKCSTLCGKMTEIMINCTDFICVLTPKILENMRLDYKGLLNREFTLTASSDMSFW